MGRGVPAHCLCCLHPHSGRDTCCRRLPRVGTVLVTAGSRCQAIPVSGSLPSRHVPGRGPGLRDSDASGHKPKAGEPAPLSPSACRGWTPRTPPCCLGVGAGRGACAPPAPRGGVSPVPAALPARPLPALPELPVHPFPSAGWAGAGVGELAVLPSIPFPARPSVSSPCPLPVPQLGGEPGCGAQAAPG